MERPPRHETLDLGVMLNNMLNDQDSFDYSHFS